MACRRAIVRRRWQRAALTLRCCVRSNCITICSAYFREQCPPRAHSGTSVAVAARTWQTVRSGFFPPVRQAELTEEDMAEATEDQMSLNRAELANLEVIHPQFGVNTSTRGGGLEGEPLKAGCLGAAYGGSQSNICSWSKRRSSSSCRRIYSRIAFSSRPTVDAK